MMFDVPDPQLTPDLTKTSTQKPITLCCICFYAVSQKVPTYELSVTLSNLNWFWKCLHCWKAHEICYKPHITYPLHLSHVATLPWEFLIQIFCRYSADKLWKKMQTNCTLIASNLANRSPYWLSNIISQFAVVLSIYFCDQFMAPEMCHSRCHCRVCQRRWMPRWLLSQQSTWYSATKTGFW